MNNMKMRAMMLVTAILVGAAGSAEADYINLAFVGNGISGAAVLTVKANGDGSYTALTGTLDVLGDTAVRTASLVANPNGTGQSFAPGVPFFFGAFDDQLFPSATPVVDGNGLFFVSGVNDIFIYSFGSTTTSYAYLDYNTKTGASFQPLGLQVLVSAVQPGNPPTIPSLGSVPEPSSLAMCGIAGVAGLGLARRRLRSGRIAA